MENSLEDQLLTHILVEISTNPVPSLMENLIRGFVCKTGSDTPRMLKLSNGLADMVFEVFLFFDLKFHGAS